MSAHTEQLLAGGLVVLAVFLLCAAVCAGWWWVAEWRSPNPRHRPDRREDT